MNGSRRTRFSTVSKVLASCYALIDTGRRGGKLPAAGRKEAAVRNRKDPARIALYSILGEVQGWSGGLAAEDDATLVVAKVR